MPTALIWPDRDAVSPGAANLQLRPAYILSVVAFLYLVMTISLSLLIRLAETRLNRHERR